MESPKPFRIAARICLALMLLPFGTTRGADLIDLYSRATDHDPTFLAAAYQREVADQALAEARAGARPEIRSDLSFGYTYQDVRDSESFLWVEGSSDWYSGRFSLSIAQPVYSLEMLARFDQARAEIRQAAATYVAAEQDLMLRVAQSYFSLLAALDALDLATAEKTANWRQLVETEERLGAGLATATDAHDARARFALAEAAEIDATVALDDARQAVVEIAGILPETEDRLSESFPLLPPDRPDVEVWVEAALFQNPAVRAREAAVEVARQESRRQRSARLPSLDLAARYDDSNTSGTEFLLGGGTAIGTGNVELRLRLPIWDGGRTDARVRTTALRQRVAAQELEREKQRTERETRAAFRGVTSGTQRVEALSKSVFANEAALAEKEVGLRSGLETGRAVLDARRDLFSARRDLTQARYVYILNGLKLKALSGILSPDDLRRIDAFLQ